MENKILLHDDDGNEIELIVEATFEIDTDKYVVMYESEEDEDYYIMKYSEDNEGNLVFTGLDDEELREAQEAYEELDKTNK
ncbi:DUF1292 domain-containing protein [Fenollaria timonensis]|uniref:DUF1292 domain-containing protein n=1 Tax=Fenollaria timonensis TaxID=1723384 RepID=UPI00071DD7C5|nr:DUF1292 domain-containing protein [Fenollaria timonensis]